MNTLFLPELREMLQTNDLAGLAEFCTALHPARTAEFMEGLDPQESWAVLKATDLSNRTSIFGFLDKEKQGQILESGDPQELSELITEMPSDDRVDLINRVQPETAEAVLQLIPAEQRRDIMRLRQHPEGTAGAVMTTEVAWLPENLTVAEALREIGRQAQDLETIYYIYIVDDENHLRGLVSARQLVTRLGKPDTKLSDFMERDLVTVEVADDQENVAGKVADFDFLAIPVVDHEQHLLGIITHDDVIDVLREEAEEDAYRAAAVEPLQSTYLQTSFLQLAWKRGVWLIVLFACALLTTFALRSYESALERITWLVFFIPLIMSSGGNTGGQSSTLIIRALANNDITPADARRVIIRELQTGLALGSVLAVLAFIAGLMLVEGPTPQELMVIPMALLVVVVYGTLLGATLPLVFRRLGLDEALMSTPFVTVLVDIGGILIYMTVAMTMIAELSGSAPVP